MNLLPSATAGPMTLAELRRLAESLPPGTSLTLPRDALLELCSMLGAPAGIEVGGDLTAAQLAERLGRKPSTVRGWCEQGELSGAYRLNGREWRIPPAALEAFLADRRPGHNGKCRRRESLGDWRDLRARATVPSS